jgi:hypothetical protein
MLYSIETYSKAVLQDYSTGKLSPMGYSLHAYCKAITQDLQGIVRRDQ